MDSVFILPAIVPSVSKASPKEFFIDIASFVKHLVEEENVVIVDSD